MNVSLQLKFTSTIFSLRDRPAAETIQMKIVYLYVIRLSDKLELKYADTDNDYFDILKI